MIWHNGSDPFRPDRYLDWEIQARTLPATEQDGNIRVGSPSAFPSLAFAEQWASVQIEVVDRNTIRANGALLDNLRWLEKAVNGEQTEIGSFDPKMSSHELARLKRRIGELENGNGETEEVAPLLPRFFIYLHEDQVYEQGKYREFARFDIVFAGPPIANFNRDVKPERRDTIVAMAANPVVVGIIDDGIAFAHDRFQGRVNRVWLQDVERVDGSAQVEFGRILHEEDIDRIRKQVASNLGPEADETDFYRHPDVAQIDFGQERHPSIAFRIAHGTHVMDLAAGCDPEDAVGAPQIMAVQLPPAVTEDTSGTKLASYVLNGINAIIGWADELGEEIPLVINFSYGFTAGPKDGSQNLEAAIDRIVRERQSRGAPTAVVLPAGNSFEKRTVAQVTLGTGDVEELDWVLSPDDETENYLEIWVDQEVPGSNSMESSPPLDVTLIPPSESDADPPTHAYDKLSFLSREGRRIAGIYCDKVESGSDAQKIRCRYMLAINRTKDSSGHVQAAPSGPWKVRLAAAAGTTGRYLVKLYIQRDDTPTGYVRRGRQSVFDHPHAHERDEKTGDYDSLGSAALPCPITGQETLTAIGTGSEVVVVGGIKDEDLCLPAEYTASGPARSKCGPDLCALSDEGDVFKGVFAAGTRSGSRVAMRGTSVAAPQVTRWIAKMMSKGEWTATTSIADLEATLVADTDGSEDTQGHSFPSRSQRLGIGRVELTRHAELRRRQKD
nr:S8 family serine peptidase [uncultured Roseibium sp.]